MSADCPLLVFEEHCTVLAEWRRRGLRGRTLVYLDAHLDLQYVNRERMARLRAAPSDEAFAALEKPDHLLPDGNYVYGLENFLYPASELGIVDHLIWIAPPHVEIGHSERALGYAQQMDGVRFEELTGLRKVSEGWHEARLLGLEMTLCSLDRLKDLNIPPGSLVDVDTDFFVALPADRAWIDPAAVHAELARWIQEPALVSLSRSVGSGFMPLRYRYFADYLRALWLEDGEAAAHYARLYRWEEQLGAPARGPLDGALEAELETFPDCPATHYLYARWAPEERTHALQAASLSSAYRDDAVRIASETASRHLATPIETLDRLKSRIERAEASPPFRGLVALGLAYAERGAARQALDCYRALDTDHPALALAVAGLLGDASDRATRRALLEVATREDASATSAHLQLAELDIRERAYASAKRHLEQAHANAPAWLEPIRGLAWLHARTEAGKTNAYAEELARRSRILRALVH